LSLDNPALLAPSLEIRTRKKTIQPKGENQSLFVGSLLNDDISFGVGPAGTGKTYLAVTAAAHKLVDGTADRIIVSRPAVEAGEKLGYLPGDMKDKVDPYMQPIYDALNDAFPGKQLAKLIEEKQIEIAPLAFMRGRTFHKAAVVLDEAQNATVMQMKMFLTRMGSDCTMAITGDPGQVDLPRGMESGLVDAVARLTGVSGISIVKFTNDDVARHPLVKAILKAYDD
jgi:phosphate starvation-inducible protein PhoH and related proteins